MIRYSSLFTSRWFALLWCVLICLTAIQFVGSDEAGDASAAKDDGVANALNAAGY